jgi:hypothetical protein
MQMQIKAMRAPPPVACGNCAAANDIDVDIDHVEIAAA